MVEAYVLAIRFRAAPRHRHCFAWWWPAGWTRSCEWPERI